jgi:hypothetical protein
MVLPFRASRLTWQNIVARGLRAIDLEELMKTDVRMTPFWIEICSRAPPVIETGLSTIRERHSIFSVEGTEKRCKMFDRSWIVWLYCNTPETKRQAECIQHGQRRVPHPLIGPNSFLRLAFQYERGNVLQWHGSRENLPTAVVVR